MAMTVEQQRALALARARLRAKQAQQPVEQGMILPISRNASGDVSFDSDAGLLGVAKRAFMLPGQVMRGEVDPMSDQGIERAAEFAGIATPVSAAMRAGERLVPGVSQALRRERPKPPTAEALRNEASRGYDAARDMSVDFSSTSVRDMARNLQIELEQDGILPVLAPKAFRVLKQLQQAPDDSVAPLAGLEAARRAFNNAAKDFNNPTDQLAARRIRDRLDGFMLEPPPQSVVAGPAAAASTTLKEARGNYAAAKRSDTLTGLRDSAELRAAVANSGQNLDNATRQRLRALLENQRQSAGFSGDERAAIEGVARGSRTSNFLRGTGNVLGGGGGMGMMLTGSIGGGAGALAGGPIGAALGAAIPTAAGAGAKRVAAALTQTGLRGVDEMTRMRSPLYERMLAEAPLDAINADRRAAVVRALIATSMAEQN